MWYDISRSKVILHFVNYFSWVVKLSLFSFFWGKGCDLPVRNVPIFCEIAFQFLTHRKEWYRQHISSSDFCNFDPFLKFAWLWNCYFAKNPVFKSSQTTAKTFFFPPDDDDDELDSCQTKVMKILLILAVLPMIQSCSRTYGELGEWSTWTDCSQTCGHSVRTRIRNCSTKKCNGIQIEAENCPDLPPCSTTSIIISIPD